jgi:hypothetical protein
VKIYIQHKKAHHTQKGRKKKGKKEFGGGFALEIDKN